MRRRGRNHQRSHDRSALLHRVEDRVTELELQRNPIEAAAPREPGQRESLGRTPQSEHINILIHILT